MFREHAKPRGGAQTKVSGDEPLVEGDKCTHGPAEQNVYFPVLCIS